MLDPALMVLMWAATGGLPVLSTCPSAWRAVQQHPCVTSASPGLALSQATTRLVLRATRESPGCVPARQNLETPTDVTNFLSKEAGNAAGSTQS